MPQFLYFRVILPFDLFILVFENTVIKCAIMQKEDVSKPTHPQMIHADFLQCCTGKHARTEVGRIMSPYFSINLTRNSI